MSLASLKTTSEKVDTGEILDVLGPRIQFLTALSDNDNDYCLSKGSVPHIFRLTGTAPQSSVHGEANDCVSYVTCRAVGGARYASAHAAGYRRR